MDTAEVERAVEPYGGSSGGRTYDRYAKGDERGGQFAPSPNATSGAAASATPGPYRPRPKKGGGAAPTAPRASSKFKTLAMDEDNDPQAVAEMQQLLTALGLGNLTSGVYDDATKAAVMEVQRRLGIKNPNGKASKALINKMLNAYDLSPCVKRSEDCDDTFTVTRSEGDVFDILRESVEDDEDVVEVVERAELSSAEINDLPDSAFAYIEPGGTKDSEGKTVPRSLRHFPLHDEPHVRNALSRMSQSPHGQHAAKKIHAAAKKYGIQMAEDTQRSCCPDCLEGESHVFRREWTLDGIDIIRGGQGGDGRTVDAYATPFDKPTEVKDQHGHYMETIHRSAFDEVLRGGIGKVRVFYNHGMHLNGTPSDRWSVPIGTPLEIRPDGKGLRTITRYNEGADGDQIIEAIRNGAITGYSFRGPIRQSDPPRIPRARDGHPLPTVTRMKLGLTEYGPTPVPYYADANILALRSRLSTVDPQVWDRLVDFFSASTPEDQEALRTAITATPTEGPGAEDQHVVHSGRQIDIARRIRAERIRRGIA